MKTKPRSLKNCFKLLAVGSSVFVTLLTFSPAQTWANTVGLDFTGGTQLLGDSITVGWAFSLSSAVTVTDLGLWDQGSNGLAVPQQVIIWTSAGMQKVQAIVDNSGTFVPSSVNGFRYVSVAPTLLGPGNYTISASIFGNADGFIANAATITTASPVTYIGSRSISGGPNAFPPGDSFGNPNGYFGPNFQFTTNFAVPESGGTILLMLGSLSCLVLLRRLLPVAAR